MQVAEEMETQFVSEDNEEHLTEAPLAVLEENGNNSNLWTKKCKMTRLNSASGK